MAGGRAAVYSSSARPWRGGEADDGSMLLPSTQLALPSVATSASWFLAVRACSGSAEAALEHQLGDRAVADGVGDVAPQRWSARCACFPILVVPGFECLSGRGLLDGQLGSGAAPSSRARCSAGAGQGGGGEHTQEEVPADPAARAMSSEPGAVCLTRPSARRRRKGGRS